LPYTVSYRIIPFHLFIGTGKRHTVGGYFFRTALLWNGAFMARRKSKPLTDTFCKQVKYQAVNDNGKPATNGQKYFDGGGLFLHVRDVTQKYWRMDYQFHHKRKTLALGPYPEISLAQARLGRDNAKSLLAQGIDPSEHKQVEAAKVKAALSETFEKVATDWQQKTKSTRSESTEGKITQWLKRDILPYLGKTPIAKIGPPDVLRTVRKIETRGAIDTAHRVKQLIGQVMRFGVATGVCERDPTQDLKGALATHEVTHYPAITEPKAFGQLLRAIDGYAGQSPTKAMLQIAPLVFLRAGELRHAEWSEIDLETATWAIPAVKMKMKSAHIVPLSTQAVAILKALYPITGHGMFVFPSIRTDARPTSENTLNAALRALGYAKDVHCGHGFRASARTMLDEVLGERVDLIEHQLAHAVKDTNGRAYNRTAHLQERRAMMQRWADYLDELKADTAI
jgi:integrase